MEKISGSLSEAVHDSILTAKRVQMMAKMTNVAKFEGASSRCVICHHLEKVLILRYLPLKLLLPPQT